jgi:putative flippase GtrA
VVAAAVTRLSIKLPAVALGRSDFTFRDAWTSSADNFWQLLGVFLLNAAIVFGTLLVLILVVNGIGEISPAAAQAVAVVVDTALKLFLTLFNASIFTSLYGFFVERRDF